MDDTIAAKLTELFKDKSWKHPIDIKLFEVFFSIRTGTDMKFKLSTPEELSSVLKHIIDNADGAVFQIEVVFNRRGLCTSRIGLGCLLRLLLREYRRLVCSRH